MAYVLISCLPLPLMAIGTRIGGKFKKPEKRKTVITKTLASPKPASVLVKGFHNFRFF